MDTELAWTFAILLALLVALLTIDFIKAWRQQRREKESPSHGAPFDKDAFGGVPGGHALRGAEALAGVDLLGRDRPVFRVVLPPDGLELHLFTPTKAVSDRFSELGDVLQRIARGRGTLEDLEALFSYAAVILNNNRENMAITSGFVTERCGAEDVVILLTDYMNWLTEQVKEKN